MKHTQLQNFGREIWLLDNGSLAPASIRQHRRIAAALGKKIARTVTPVSVLHSNRVPPASLGGKKAEIFEHALKRAVAAGTRAVEILPLFVGPSGALTDYVPLRLAGMRKECPELRVGMAEALGAPRDDVLARILASEVRVKLTPAFLRGAKAKIAVVDHGSPSRAVTRVRNRVAKTLQRLLGASVAQVAPCSMERRADAEFDFNKPLLAELLSKPGWNEGPVVVAQLFLLPGRHAGPRGDLAQICREAKAMEPGLRITRTKLLGTNPALVGLLATRWRELAKSKAKLPRGIRAVRRRLGSR
ncbi:MAG: CbiX [Verrucomicrobia bacterium]|nr:CbiX [Verrucomicrobiota bacterium]